MAWFNIFKKKKTTETKYEEVRNSIEAYEIALRVKMNNESEKLKQYNTYLHDKLQAIQHEITENANKGGFVIGCEVYVLDRDVDRTEKMISDVITDKLIDLGYKIRITELDNYRGIKLRISISWNK